MLTLKNILLKQRITAILKDMIFKDGNPHCYLLQLLPLLAKGLQSSPVTVRIQFYKQSTSSGFVYKARTQFKINFKHQLLLIKK
jgi:hypothetical protein